MWSRSPPRASVIALVRVPGLFDVPPQGASFCGSPSSFWTACWSVPSEQNGERRRTGPAKQLRQWPSVRNFSPESPPCCVFECSTLATLSHRKQQGEDL